jgi:hypothetical protein
MATLEQSGNAPVLNQRPEDEIRLSVWEQPCLIRGQASVNVLFVDLPKFTLVIPLGRCNLAPLQILIERLVRDCA